MANVGIVIVSHSPKIAEGAADMVRQMVGDSVNLAHTGGDPDGRLGTSVASILAAIDRAWSEAGVAIMLDPGRRGRVVVCNAPIVEGAVIAATEASGGSPLDIVRHTAEELSR
jgi:PTS hybrid protein